jgi:hypothetical protein
MVRNEFITSTLLFITDVNNLPKQLKIVIGRKFLGSVFEPGFV